MRKSIQITGFAFVLVGGLALASPLLAEDAQPTPDKGSGMMGGGDMMGGKDMMNGQDMGGMMKMMAQMSQMMESCNKMMQTATKEDQKPVQPDRQ